MDPTEKKEVDAEGDGDGEGKVLEVTGEEDASVVFKPLVELPEIQVTNCEEDEECVFKMRSKLFRFAKETNEWKERGVGDIRIMKHKTNGRCRLLMRREKTLKVCCNHFLTPILKLENNIASDRSWSWFARDFSDEAGTIEQHTCMLAIRFGTPENANLFKEAFEKAQSQTKHLWDANGNETEPEKPKTAEVKAE